ncbi:MerR family transcriptional regulator [Massilia endophytica]|uniref:MerR family transcriptional regulator n=1 Tax=Massilia endophytica TaxID=2899220 RepID=UPI001E5E84DE|nr:MerR family transcriptional regulator [Massilia endophytica]UGQ45276.1 MerR family DNA-binding transcriptional regulator [Massilia endophytica]
MLKIGELATRAGLTVRTLHHYDSIGLLQPSARSDSGYRLYCHQDVVRLHHIQALRRFGMALTDIGAFLANPEASPLSIVVRQIEALDRQIEEAGRVRAQLTRLHEQLSEGEEPALAAWLTTLELMTMYEKYFSKEELEQLPLYQNPEAEYEWKLLAMQVKQAMEGGLTPKDAHHLALRWMEMLDRDTGGNIELMSRLDRMHISEPSVQKETGIGLDMRSYIMRAISEVKLGLYAKYLLPDELAQMRRHFDSRGQEWPGLIEQIKAQMRADPSPNNPAARTLSAKWMALFRDMVGTNPETIGRFRTATESEPTLRLGRGMNDEMIAFLRAADGR